MGSMEHVVDVAFHVGFYLFIFIIYLNLFFKKLPFVKKKRIKFAFGEAREEPGTSLKG